jgi:hypothetical protein
MQHTNYFKADSKSIKTQSPNSIDLTIFEMNNLCPIQQARDIHYQCTNVPSNNKN